MARILLIDDEDDVREMFSEVLVRDGHEVVSLANGNGAAAQDGHPPPDLVITDILMPERDGMEVICALRRHAPETKIIAISGGCLLGPALYLKAAEVLGADRTLAKPIAGAELIAAVHELLAS